MGFGEYGIVGCGPWGLRLLSILRDEFGAGIVGAVADLRPEALTEALRIDASLTCEPDGFALLKRPELRGIFIATPTPTHGPLVEAALERGLDVYVEKVSSMAPEQAAHLAHLAVREGCRLELGLPWQHGPVALALRDRFEDLGPLRRVETRRVGKVELRRSEGVIWDLLPHDLAMVLDLEGGEPEAVRVDGLGFEEGSSAPVEATVELRWDRGFRSWHRVSWIDGETIRRWELTGERGIARVEEVNRCRTFHLDEVLVTSDTVEPLKDALRAFLEGAAPSATAAPDWTARLAHLLAATDEGARNPGQWVVVVPELAPGAPAGIAAA